MDAATMDELPEINPLVLDPEVRKAISLAADIVSGVCTLPEDVGDKTLLANILGTLYEDLWLESNQMTEEWKTLSKRREANWCSIVRTNAAILGLLGDENSLATPFFSFTKFMDTVRVVDKRHDSPSKRRLPQWARSRYPEAPTPKRSARRVRRFLCKKKNG